MRPQLLAPLCALFLVVGCANEGSYHLNVRHTGTASESVWRDRVYEIVRACAAEHGYQPHHVERMTPGPPFAAAYLLTGLGAEQNGQSYLIVRQPDRAGLTMFVTTEPEPDYPQVQQLRAKLERQLKKEFGAKAVSGF